MRKTEKIYFAWRNKTKLTHIPPPPIPPNPSPYPPQVMLAKSLTYALLLNLGWRVLFGFVLADVGLFLLLKALRGDLRFVVKGGVGGGLENFLSRILMKVFADFTALPM